MLRMNIQPGGSAGLQLTYAVGQFMEEDDSFLVAQLGGESPFGSILCSLGSEYAVHIAPDGSGRSLYGGLDVTPITGQGKAWYVKDRESGSVWSPFFSPVCERANEYEVRYLPGRATVHSLKDKIASTLTVSTVPGYPCEIWRVKLENRSAVNRSLTFTTFIEPCIGVNLEATYLGPQKALLIRRPLSAVEPGAGDSTHDMVVFHSSTLTPTRYQTDRSAFVGEGRTLRSPQELDEKREESETGTSKVIASLTVDIELPIEGEAEFAFCLGVAESPEEALEISQKLGSMHAVNELLKVSEGYWQDLCSAVKVKTPDRALDAMINTWLPYEAYAGWIRQRTGGVCLDPARVADVLRRLYALIPTAPHICHENLLSFAAGLSVLGTYSPDSGSLVSLPARELLWLAACAERYVAETGDTSTLTEIVPLRDGPELTLKEHCERVIRMCIHGEGAAFDPLLEQVVRHWALISGGADEFAPYIEGIENRRMLEKPDRGEQRHLPRRVKFFQTASPALSDSDVSDKIDNFFSMDASPDGESGAACCVYAAVVETVLGLQATAEGLSLHPRLPESWKHCEVTRTYKGDTYRITIKQTSAPSKKAISVVVDGEPVLGDMLPFFNDGAEHQVDVVVRSER